MQKKVKGQHNTKYHMQATIKKEKILQSDGGQANKLNSYKLELFNRIQQAYLVESKWD